MQQWLHNGNIHQIYGNLFMLQITRAKPLSKDEKTSAEERGLLSVSFIDTYIGEFF